MLSGLVHDDTPVFRDGRAFLTAGGPGSSSFAASAADRSSALRYLRLKPEGGGVAVEVRCLDPEGAGFTTAKRFDLRWSG